MALVHVTITGRDRRHLQALGKKLRGPKLRVVVVGFREDEKGAIVDAYIPSGKVDWIRRQGYGVTILEERVDQHDRARQKEGRKAVGTRLKKGRYGDVIWGGGYLDVDEVEAAMELGERNHGGYCERIELPNETWEKRTCHAFRIGRLPAGKDRNRRRLAFCFMGGVHGREWGGPDILIYFGMRLLRAYRDKKGIQLGSKRFTATQVKRIVETRDIYLIPQVNPDGRAFSMNRHPMWRKNRRPAPKGAAGHKAVGVDINCNYPFLWRYDRHFAPGTIMSSHNPNDYESYVGPREASEPETRNVIWLLGRIPNLGYFVDLHSYGESILHSWGGDANQTEDPEMSFLNPAYDGKRGRINDKVYREYIPAEDEALAIRMGRRMADAIGKVRGRDYKVKQSVGLYPTAGASDDYVYSRHLIDPKNPKTIAYTFEWGRSQANTPFHPPYPEMRKVMREITAGLIELCLNAEEAPAGGRSRTAQRRTR
jgi:carboxypeptidase T